MVRDKGTYTVCALPTSPKPLSSKMSFGLERVPVHFNVYYPELWGQFCFV